MIHLRFFSKVAFLLGVALLPLPAAASYFPKAIFGTPVRASVVALDGPDFRGQPAYRIEFTALTKDGEEADSFIHRSYTDFQLFDALKSWYYKDLKLPSEAEATVESLDAYIQDTLMKYNSLAQTVLYGDFLGINWDGNDPKYLKNYLSFMKFLIVDHLPTFAPEPPVIDSEDDTLEPVTPFENYIFMRSFRHDDMGFEAFYEYYENYVATLPVFAGEPDHSDVWAPGITSPVEYPYHYDKTYVHFNPGGYLNGHTVRMSYSTYNKFNFESEGIIKPWLEQLHGQRKPKRILEIGTGTCASAFALGEIFPNAEVIAIDLAPAYIRFCRMWKKKRGAPNVFFYQANGEATPFESESFDIVQFTYVLHEMPQQNSKRVLREIHRLLKPEGVVSGFDVLYWQNPEWRQMNVESSTWGEPWNTTGQHGPEPYMDEYQNGLQLPNFLQEIGFQIQYNIRYSNFDGIYVARKPHFLL
ncbi:uncharacterized protein LOC110984384 [Acanthaster planci]|uniref:Uncharacterized protein LOC110984384 n=1 Tax=Acanthaster planci TaxID=133434 RepID=A0A8B7ZAG2_ACAPL|nr:uncharacterized protein LOC110984384 [Acanthaster planci]